MSSRQSFCWSGGWQWRTARGAGRARTSSYVRRSSIPSRRPCLARASMLACMLVLSASRSTNLALGYHAYGTASAMTLLILRLLRVAWNMYSRRGLCSLVLGPGGIMSFLVDVHSSAGVHSTVRLLWRWWKRRRRGCCPRSLLLRWHVDEENKDLAHVNAGSGSHNLDTPYLARQRCRGELIHEHLWGRQTGPLSVRRRAEVARRADRGEAHEQFTQVRAARMRKTLLLLVCVY